MDKYYYIELFEIYKSLLTDKQADVFSLYACDLSLGEISEIKKVSRQGVADAISKTKEILSSYEEKLMLYKKRNALKKVVGDIQDTKVKEDILKIIEG